MYVYNGFKPITRGGASRGTYLHICYDMDTLILMLILAVGAFDSESQLQSTSSIVYQVGIDSNFRGSRILEDNLYVLV